MMTRYIFLKGCGCLMILLATWHLLILCGCCFREIFWWYSFDVLRMIKCYID
ncbi:uncharacterized protein DS421_1g17460 [Arachis hypogaea]|nr:uncharacterized protein DS421_1g17460 [Arachis hypogaea]